MEPAEHDPVELITKLARVMVLERRGRFLDAACGNDPDLRNQVEARLRDAGERKHDNEQATVATTEEHAEPESSPVEAIAQEVLSTPRETPTDIEPSSDSASQEDQPIDMFCRQKCLDPLARL